MAVESASIRQSLMSDFGTTATFTHAGGAAVSVVGIFDNNYEALDVGGSVSFAVQQPRFLCPTAGIPLAEEGDVLVVDAVTYLITVVMADGTGFTELQIEKQ